MGQKTLLKEIAETSEKRRQGGFFRYTGYPRMGGIGGLVVVGMDFFFAELW